MSKRAGRKGNVGMVERRNSGVRYASRHVEYVGWRSVSVAGYMLGYSLTMKSKNNDKTRVMIIIIIIIIIAAATMMSRQVVSTAPI